MTDEIYLLPIRETVTSAWAQVKGAKQSFWAAFGLIFLILISFGIADEIARTITHSLSYIIRLLAQLVSFLLQIGLLYIGINRARALPISYRMIFFTLQFDIAIRAIGVYLLRFAILLIPSLFVFAIPVIMIRHSVLAQIVSALLFIVAAVAFIYLAVRMAVSMGFVLDKKANPWSAIKLSFRATRSNFFRILALYLIQIGIMVISIIPLGIGLIWSLPLVLIIYGRIYTHLLVNIDR